jgi:hypothetical protein
MPASLKHFVQQAGVEDGAALLPQPDGTTEEAGIEDEAAMEDEIGPTGLDEEPEADHDPEGAPE